MQSWLIWVLGETTWGNLRRHFIRCTTRLLATLKPSSNRCLDLSYPSQFPPITVPQNLLLCKKTTLSSVIRHVQHRYLISNNITGHFCFIIKLGLFHRKLYNIMYICLTPFSSFTNQNISFRNLNPNSAHLALSVRPSTGLPQ